MLLISQARRPLRRAERIVPPSGDQRDRIRGIANGRSCQHMRACERVHDTNARYSKHRRCVLLAIINPLLQLQSRIRKQIMSTQTSRATLKTLHPRHNNFGYQVARPNDTGNNLSLRRPLQAFVAVTKSSQPCNKNDHRLTNGSESSQLPTCSGELQMTTPPLCQLPLISSRAPLERMDLEKAAASS